MLVEEKLAKGFGYGRCILFPYARVAIAYWKFLIAGNRPVFIPSNVCPALANAFGDSARPIPVSAGTGLAPQIDMVLVQLYGTRVKALPHTWLEIDPMLTGWGREPQAKALIVSFGYGKTIDIGGGAALLTSDEATWNTFYGLGQFPADRRRDLEYQIDRLDENIGCRRDRFAIWEKYLAASVVMFKRPSFDPIVPWRVIRTIPHELDRDEIVSTLRGRGLRMGTNYPPLPGVTDPSAKAWGDSVVNFFLEDEPL